MKANITITCDRCGKIVEGTLEGTQAMDNIITEGYYIVNEGNWKEFGRWEEEVVCDDCMHSDPKYKKIYD